MKNLLICCSLLITSCLYSTDKSNVLSNYFETASLGTKKIFVSWIENKQCKNMKDDFQDDDFEEDELECTNNCCINLQEKYMLLNNDLCIKNTNIIKKVKNLLAKVNIEYGIFAPAEMIYLILVNDENRCLAIVSLDYFNYDISLFYGTTKKNRVYFNLNDGCITYVSEAKSKELFEFLIPIILKMEISQEKIKNIKRYYPNESK